jgi:deoxyribodipyrimidine photo-lyase
MSNRTGIGTSLPPRRRRRLVWHRTKDLRYHDHPFYCSDDDDDDNGVDNNHSDNKKNDQNTAAAAATTTRSNTPITSTITSVFIFDDQVCCGLRPSTCRPKEWMAVNIGPHGARVLLESVSDLRRRRPPLSTTTTTTMTESLIVRKGSTVPILLQLIDEIINISDDDCNDDDVNNSNDNDNDDNDDDTRMKTTTEYEICWNEEPGIFEMELSREARQAISTRFPNVRIRTTMSCTLYHPDDLPKTKNDWLPITINRKKKEKKQRQRLQRMKQQQQQQQQQQNEDQKKSDFYNSIIDVDNNYKNDDAKMNNIEIEIDSKQKQKQTDSDSNSIINISSERWKGMPQIMGEFRRTAREKAGVRPCFELLSCSSTIIGDDDGPINDNDDDDDGICIGSGIGYDDNNNNNSSSNSGIDPGELPTLESLLEPLLLYAMDDEQEDRKPIMGLPSSIIREVCHHALRIYHENNNTPKTTTTLLAQHNRRGGESNGLSHLDNFCRNYASKAQRNLACVDNHQSSHLSHYLAFGCLSPRTVVEEVERQQQRMRGRNNNNNNNNSVTSCKKNKNDNDNDKNNDYDENENDCSWLISHMTMRDFFLYTCLASEKQFYRLEGIPVNKKYAESILWKSFVEDDNDDVIVVDDDSVDGETTTTHNLWKDWALGNTGLPLVDAAMKEMIQTGYCSNRVRQNVASVLTKDFNIDWRAGAEWFQFLLHDHCVGANWGNWLYFSGVGSDPKQRHFCTVSQALKYDKDGTYVKKWLPKLKSSSFCSVTSSTKNKYYEEEFHLRPWDFDSSWKRPPISLDSQYTWRDLQRLKETGRLMPFSTDTNIT